VRSLRKGKEKVVEGDQEPKKNRRRATRDKARPPRTTPAQRRAQRRAERPPLTVKQAFRIFVPWLVLLGALIAYPFVVSGYWARIGVFVAVYALVALSLTVLTGWAGSVSLGQAGFVGLGAFAAAYLTQHGVPFVLWIPIAVAASVPASLVTGLAALRLPGLYFAVVTLAFNLVAQFLVFIPLENHRITAINRPEIGSLDFADERKLFLLVAAIVAVCFGAMMRVGRGKTGRALLAVRHSATTAAASGINTAYYRTMATVVSGALATTAGVLLGTLIESVRSDQFTPFTSIGYLANAVIGGLGSVFGAVLAGAVPVLPLELVRPYLKGTSFLSQFTPLVQSALLLAAIVARPDGLAGLGQAVGVRLGWRKPRPARELAFLPRTVFSGTPRAPVFSGTPRAPEATVPVELDLGRFEIQPGALLEVFGDRIVEGKEEAPGGPGVSPDITAAPPALAIESALVAFGAVQALDGVSLRIEPGELVGIIGPNGAGKTTLVNVCSGFQAHSGRVLLDGEDITGLPAHIRVRAGLGRTFQTPRLIASMSVFENLLVGAHSRLRYGLPAEVVGFSYALRDELAERARVRKLLAVIGLAPLAERAAGELPSGLLKVAEVARALVEEPRVLLLDEPSAGLDPDETRWLGELIRAVAGELGIAVGLIEHDMSLAMGVSDYIYVLEAGKVLTSGRPGEVRADARVIAAYLGKEVAA
jgi:ABC-type branched-subunit amino acid transport system ATPase component/ABC-type branched-subunit amino acid transport system permease subunit